MKTPQVDALPGMAPLGVPPLRKRSEAGKARQPVQTSIEQAVATQTQAVVAQVRKTVEALTPAPGPTPAEMDAWAKGDAAKHTQPEPMEDISAFVIALKNAGFGVSLIVAAQWGTSVRSEIRKWLVTKNPATIPPVLDKLRVPDRAAEESREAVRVLLMAKGVHPNHAEIMKWTPTQVDVAKAWLTEGAKVEDLPDWLDAFRVKPIDRAALEEGVAKPSGEDFTHAKKVVTSSTYGKQGVERPDWKPPEEKPLIGVKTPANTTTVPGGAPMKREDLPEVWGGPAERPSARELPIVSESPDFNRLIETVLKEINLDHEYDELESLLEVGDNRRDYATVYEALDKAERRALRAHGLWANARLEYERLKLDQKEVDSDLWKQAMTQLEKDGSKTRIADVDAKIAEMFPDEWRGGKMRLKKAELAVERCEKFSELWSQKVRSLNSMLTSVRK
jgi:hypothetical protein